MSSLLRGGSSSYITLQHYSLCALPLKITNPEEMRFHEGEAGGEERLQYDDDEDDEGHADNNDEHTSFLN